MPKSKPKAVAAWSIVNKHEPYIWAYWTFDSKRDARSPLGPSDRWIRVEIRPLPVKPRRARRKA